MQCCPSFFESDVWSHDNAEMSRCADVNLYGIFLWALHRKTRRTRSLWFCPLDRAWNTSTSPASSVRVDKQFNINVRLWGCSPSLIQVHEEHHVISETRQPVWRGHGDDERKHVIDKRVKSLWEKQVSDYKKTQLTL